MTQRELVRVEILLEPETYERFVVLVGSRKISPTLRRLAEQFCEQEPVRRAIDAIKADRGATG